MNVARHWRISCRPMDQLTAEPIRVGSRSRMKKALEITLGVVTSIGGFIDAGALATSLQAGARFGYRLMWATLLGTVCAIFLTEMSGRLAVVSHHPLRELIHKRF